jgi:hypothetical protein
MPSPSLFEPKPVADGPLAQTGLQQAVTADVKQQK